MPHELQQHTFDRIVRKGTDLDDECFSAFASVQKRRDTGLEGFLKKHCVQQVYITGVTLEQCVKQTALDAMQAGFKTFIVTDACAPVDPCAEQATLQQLQALGAHLIESDQVAASC